MGWSEAGSSPQVSSPSSSTWCFNEPLRRSRRRWWHLHTIPQWWQPIQLAAPTGPHQDPNYLVRELRFADDAALVAHTENVLQRVTSCFAEATQLFGLEVSLKKTEVLHQPAPKEMYCPPRISSYWRDRLTEGQSSSSPTWGTPFPQTQKLTKRWITDWQRHTVLSADSTVVSGAASTWRKPQKSASTEPWYCLSS